VAGDAREEPNEGERGCCAEGDERRHLGCDDERLVEASDVADEGRGVEEEGAERHPAPPEGEEDEQDFFGEDAERDEAGLAHAALPEDEGAEEDEADDEERIDVGFLPADEGRLVPRKADERHADRAEAGADPVEAFREIASAAG
jgi:hypothetical protein